MKGLNKRNRNRRSRRRKSVLKFPATPVDFIYMYMLFISAAVFTLARIMPWIHREWAPATQTPSHWFSQIVLV